MATEEEKAKLKAEKDAEKAAKAEEKRIADEKELAELKAQSDLVEAEKAKKEEEAREARKAAEGTKDQEKKYSMSEVEALVKKILAEERKKTEGEEVDEDELYKQKKIRLPRFQNKFIVGFKNTNTDEYFPELVIHAFDVWNEQTKRNDPWVTLIFEDDSTLTVPLATILEKSQKVWVDLVERIEKDTSYSAGRTERAEVKDYSHTGTGTYVNMKVKQIHTTFKVKLPNGKEFTVGGEVINW